MQSANNIFFTAFLFLRAKLRILFWNSNNYVYFCIWVMENLKEKTAKGLLWGAVNNGTMQVLNLLIGIVLGRLLSPEEYGIVGVLAIFTAVAGALQAGGFTQGLVNLKSPTSKDYNSVFWFNISVSLILYSVLFICAPLIAAFFHQPSLVAVSRVIFLCLPISSLGITTNGYMIKNMMNREIAITNFTALVLSGMAGILLAFNGFSYWSLVWQQLLYIIVTNILRFHYVRWRPKLQIDFAPVKGMFRFCVKLLITNIINTLNQHLLTFIFGRLFPISAVGNFSQASKWNLMASSTISGTIGQVAQPVLVSIQDERDREIRVFRKLMRFTAFLTFPIMFGLSLVSKELLLVTIGDQWAESAILLQILCIGGAFLPFYVIYQNLAISNGKSNIYMWCNIGQILIQLAIILILYPRGILSVVWAYSIFSILWLFTWQIVAHRLIGLRAFDVVKDVVPFLLVSATVMMITYLLTRNVHNPHMLLLSRILIAPFIYLSIMKLARAKVMDECVRFIFHK